MTIKKLFIAALLSCYSFSASAQTDVPQAQAGAVESLFNVQAGIVGIYANYEMPLSTRWALRAEAGLDLWYYDAYKYNGTSVIKDKGTFFAPDISIEPRWYYNIEKRARKGKHTENNSANFITLTVKYYPDLFKIGGPDYIYVPNQISFTPKWGIRRAIAKSNFNYELGIGIGYLRYISDSQFLARRDDVVVDAHIRIGYTFK